MSWNLSVPQDDYFQVINGRCPICMNAVPIFTIEVEKPGRWKRNLNVTITGDATDWIAHIWSHQQEVRH